MSSSEMSGGPGNPEVPKTPPTAQEVIQGTLDSYSQLGRRAQELLVGGGDMDEYDRLVKKRVEEIATLHDRLQQSLDPTTVPLKEMLSLEQLSLSARRSLDEGYASLNSAHLMRGSNRNALEVIQKRVFGTTRKKK